MRRHLQAAALGLALALLAAGRANAYAANEARMSTAKQAREAGKSSWWPWGSKAADKASPKQAQIDLRKTRHSGMGTHIALGVIDDIDNNPEVRGQKWYGSPGKLGIAQKMLRDPHVRQSVENYIGPLTSATWRFQPVSKSPLDREVADYLTWAMFERLAWAKSLRRIVKNFNSQGFELVEITDDNVKIPRSRFPLHPGAGVGLAPTGYHEVPASTIDRWEQSKAEPSQIAGVRQFIQGADNEAAGWREIKADRLLRFTWDQEGADYAGLAVLRSAYQPWKLKMAFLTYEAIKHERSAVGTPTMTLGENASEDDIAAAEQILAAMRVNERGYVILPNGYKFEWTGSGENNVSNIGLAIERCNTDISVNVAAGFMRLGLTGPGSYALGNTQQGAYHLAVTGQANFVGAIITLGSDGWSPAERYVHYNYGADVAVPRAIVRNLPTRPWQEIVKAANDSARAGTIQPDDPLEDEIRELMQLPPRDPESSRGLASLQRVPQPQPTESGEPSDQGSQQEAHS